MAQSTQPTLNGADSPGVPVNTELFAALERHQAVGDRVAHNQVLFWVHPTRERAQVPIEARTPELQCWLQIEEVLLGNSLDVYFWKKSAKRAVAIADLAALIARILSDSGTPEQFDTKV